MCGRYLLTTTPGRIAERFDALLTPTVADFEPRYNIAPSTAAPVVRMADRGRVVELMRWGLIPHWSREPATRYPTFNARSEDAADKPTYRGPIRYRRCLVPVDGFYEWRRHERGPKQPYLVRMADGEPFALAGLWDAWQDELQSFTVLTTRPNSVLATIHDRMPVTVARADHARWLDPGVQDPRAVAGPMFDLAHVVAHSTSSRRQQRQQHHHDPDRHEVRLGEAHAGADEHAADEDHRSTVHGWASPCHQRSAPGRTVSPPVTPVTPSTRSIGLAVTT